MSLPLAYRGGVTSGTTYPAGTTYTTGTTTGTTYPAGTTYLQGQTALSYTAAAPVSYVHQAPAYHHAVYAAAPVQTVQTVQVPTVVIYPNFLLCYEIIVIDLSTGNRDSGSETDCAKGDLRESVCHCATNHSGAESYQGESHSLC